MSYFRDNPNYIHSSVNHSTNFVDPLTRANTQTIECLWGMFKRFKIRRGYSKQALLTSYQAEFTLRKRLGHDQHFTLFKLLVNLIFYYSRGLCLFKPFLLFCFLSGFFQTPANDSLFQNIRNKSHSKASNAKLSVGAASVFYVFH